jgi:hypothetical protein
MISVSVNVDSSAIGALAGRLRGAYPALFIAADRRALSRIKNLLVAEAKRNCPISPTKAQYEAALKGRGGTAVRRNAKVNVRYGKDGRVIIGASTLRSARNDFNPGVLMRSIEGESDASMAHVFTNQSSIEYADYIEDGGPHGDQNWHRRGPGTVAKGPRASDKFMRRAVDGNMRNMEDILKVELGKAVDQVNRSR